MSKLFDQYKYEPRNKSIISLIKDYEKTYQPIFIKIRTDWNLKIRDFLRDATGLKINQRRTSKLLAKETSIEIIIKPDNEDYFIRKVDEHFPDLDFTEYERIRELLVYLRKAMPFFRNKEETYFKELYNYCQYYLEANDIQKIISALFSEPRENGEVWGAYYYRDCRVELYYLPLIILSKTTGISLEYSFVTVLAHELAHAYHHIGKDNDGNIWIDMPEAETEIKEGLAQYFTHLFVEDHKQFYPDLEKAYYKMLSFQSGSYVVHKNWIYYKREAIKSALVLNRVNKNKLFGVFEAEITSINEKLTIKK